MLSLQYLKSIYAKTFPYWPLHHFYFWFMQKATRRGRKTSARTRGWRTTEESDGGDGEKKARNRRSRCPKTERGRGRERTKAERGGRGRGRKEEKMGGGRKEKEGRGEEEMGRWKEERRRATSWR